MYTPTKKREIYKKLPQKMREVIASPELNSGIVGIAKANNLDEKRQAELVKIVLDVLMGIIPKDSLFSEIKNIGIEEVLAKKISGNVELRILNNLDGIHATILSSIEAEDKDQEIPKVAIPPAQPQTPEPQIKSYDSFEQTILRQAQAMRPAQVPNNLPGARQNFSNQEIEQNLSGQATPTQTPPQQRPAGNDPYREPVE